MSAGEGREGAWHLSAATSASWPTDRHRPHALRATVRDAARGHEVEPTLGTGSVSRVSWGRSCSSTYSTASQSSTSAASAASAPTPAAAALDGCSLSVATVASLASVEEDPAPPKREKKRCVRVDDAAADCASATPAAPPPRPDEEVGCNWLAATGAFLSSADSVLTVVLKLFY